MAARTKAVKVEKLGELEGEDLLAQMIDTGIKPRGDEAHDRARELVRNFVAELLDPGMVTAKGVTKTINARIAAIDELL